jgi:DNA-binding IclR family transcriptional regulator
VDVAEQDELAAKRRAAGVKRPGDRRSLSRSATRALDVLELFGRVRRPLRAVEIARALDLHPSTADQLLKTMVGSSHLTFEATTKSYLPSPRLARFGSWMVENYGADERLRRLVRDLQTTVGETVTLTTPNDIFMQVIELADPGDGVEGAERGLRVPMFGSAIGAAFLSTLPDSEILRLAVRARIAAAEQPGLLARRLEIRREGAADGPSPDGTVWSVAVPLPDTAAPAPLVLGLAGPTERMKSNLAQLKRLMRSSVEDAGLFGSPRN